MGCIHSLPTISSSDEPRRTLPSRPLPSSPKPTRSLYFKYHRCPRLARRQQKAYDDIEATGKEKNGKWNDIETCSMTSLKVWMRHYDCEAGSEMDDAGNKEGPRDDMRGGC